MTSHKNIRLVLGLLCLLIHGFIFGQINDFGIWYGMDADRRIVKKLDLKLSSQIRTFNNASKINQALIEGGVGYKFNKYFSAAASYRYTLKLEDDTRYHSRHKWFAEMKGSVPINDFTISARFMLQIMKRTYIEDKDDEISKYVGRIRLKAEYDIPKFPLNPFLSLESFTPLFEESEVLIDKERFATGFDYKINKKNGLEISYILERYSLPDALFYHVISLKYELSF